MNGSRSRLREIAGSSLKVGVATLAGLVGWVVGGKILALELGAAGVGVFGLLRQLLQNLIVISTFAGAQALVQGVASRSDEEQATYARTVGHVFALGGGLVAAALLAGAGWLGPLLIPHPQSVALLRWVALAVLAATAQAYYTSLLSAYRAVDALVRAQLLGPVAVLAFAVPMARLVRGGRAMGLVLMLVAPSAAVAAGALLQARSRLLRGAPRRVPWREDVRSFFAMSSLVMASGLLATGAQYLLNRLVAAHLGLEQAGQFWVAWTLSMTYVTILLGSYGTYYMPSLSALKDAEARNALVHDYLRLALIVMPLIVGVVVLAKPLLVRGMFDATLLPSLKVMRWMLVGDYLKGLA
jgi:O-antigen/teichoic acid export membrane protein